MSNAKKESAHIMSRLLVICYGIGIVVLGVASIQQSHGSFFDFLKLESIKLTEKVPQIDINRRPGVEVEQKNQLVEHPLQAFSRARLKSEQEPKKEQSQAQTKGKQAEKVHLFDQQDKKSIKELIRSLP